jgi:hypothetical protein
MGMGMGMGREIGGGNNWKRWKWNCRGLAKGKERGKGKCRGATWSTSIAESGTKHPLIVRNSC